MACALPVADTLAEPARGARPGRAMTRCECAGLAFAEVERRLRENGQSLDEMARRTGCAATCTACLPDLRAYLAGR
jgi:bacterioferritin-associated ferredoxin